MIPIKDLIKTGYKTVNKFAPELLTGLAVLGTGVTGYLGVKAGMNIAVTYADKMAKGEDISPQGKTKIILKETAPVIAAGGVTIAAIISSGVISKKRMKALATSYALLAESSETFKRKVAERIGDKKMDDIRGDIAKEEFEKDAGKEIMAKETAGGTYLFKDGATKQYFRSSADYVRKMQNKVNSFYTQGENFVTVSEWYGYLGPEDPCDSMAELGWPAGSGIRFELGSCIAPNGEPAYLIMYDVPPMSMEEGELYDMNHAVENAYL